ncbi:MAG: glutaredoxin 3 [Chromatiales bacterium]|jgi:glutaredoxin 3|nr:glutaredoxin 3 [Chromatiales bacterium]MDX9766221.1 glutaredoxin 3 [Ectothiorhodospiraceae bacterium]
MSKIVMYSTAMCPYCDRAERLLVRKGAAHALEKVRVDTSPERLAEMMRITGRRTVPQIFIGDRHVGGFDDLVDLDMDGELDTLLAGLTAD